MKIGILGGGLSGLTLGNLLEHEFEILEKEAECGGLCRTEIEQGFTFDYGGCHILFSKDTEALDFALKALGDNSVRNRRHNKILYQDRFIKYPFENGLHELPLEDNFECLYEFIQTLIKKEKGELEPPKNFREWCLFTFGRGIAMKYLIPYNEKIWKFDLAEMPVDWAGGRVPHPPAEDIIKSAIGIETEGYLHQLYYYYPKVGGIQALIKSLEKPIAHRVTTSFEVGTIARDGDRWQVSDGSATRHYDCLVSTIPIFNLGRAMDSLPDEVKSALAGLKYNRLITVLLGLNTPKYQDFTAIYVPDKRVLAHRIGFPSSFSPSCVPEGKSSLLAEITCPLLDETIWQATDDAVINQVITELEQLGIVTSRNDVYYQTLRRSPYAYVIYDHNHAKNMQIIRDYFKSLGIILLGRFSRFEYLNMDACVREAMELSAQLNRGEHGQ